jgi:hypothetical protein
MNSLFSEKQLQVQAVLFCKLTSLGIELQSTTKARFYNGMDLDQSLSIFLQLAPCKELCDTEIYAES